MPDIKTPGFGTPQIFRWIARSLLGLVEMGGWSVFLLLLGWQALIIGEQHGLLSLLAVCMGGIPIFLAVMGAHEFGHVLAGWVMGMAFERFTLGPIKFFKEGVRLRARLNTAWFEPAAFVVFAPSWRADEAWRRGIMLLGGPLASILLGAACLIAAVSWSNLTSSAAYTPNVWAEWPWVAFFYPGDLVTAYLNIAGIQGVFLGVGTLIPGRVAGFRTDGGQLLDLWRLSMAVEATGFPVGAGLVILSALAELSQRGREQRGQKAAHLSGREFCDHLLVSRGGQTIATLYSYGVRRSEDVGRLMFALVNAGLVDRRASDSEADFEGLFELE
jgi:uncharacterized repeat protein (TIGR04138 family)